jgi:hypothetical protein
LYTYEATDIGFVEEHGVLTVAFGGRPDADSSPTVYLMLQRSLDEGDESGMAGVYAEWCDQGMSCYGCIGSFTLHPESIRVKFGDGANFYVPEDMGELNAERRLTELCVTFKLEDEKFRRLKERLSFIFQGCDCYSVYDVDASSILPSGVENDDRVSQVWSLK